MSTRARMARNCCRLAAVGLVLAVVITGLSTVAAAEAAGPPAARPMVGINAGWLFLDDPATWNPVLKRLNTDGYRAVRAEVGWPNVEPTAPVDGVHTYRWSTVDAVVGSLASHGLALQPVLLYAPSWATGIPGHTRTGPRDPHDYAAFCTAFAQRYGISGSFWRDHQELAPQPVRGYEIWNEPNSARYWAPQSDAPARYAALYAAASTALHQQDASAHVVVGGLVNLWPKEFLTKMLAAQPRLVDLVDGVGFHPYAASARASLAAVADIRTELNRMGANSIPIDVTEAGFSAAAMSAAARGRHYARLLRGLARTKLGVTSFFPFAAVSPEDDAGDWERWFGLYSDAGVPKPEASRLRSAIMRLDRGRRVARTSRKSRKRPRRRRAAPAMVGRLMEESWGRARTTLTL